MRLGGGKVTIRNLKKIFQPNSIAVVGASDAPQKVGCQVFRNLRVGGFKGELFPVNSKHDQVQGTCAYPSLSALPRKPDLAIVCTPAQTVPALVEECGNLGIDGMILLSAGFRETGEAGKQLEVEVKKAAARHPGLRLVGPNCLGVMVPASGLNASFAATMAAPGRVAFVSQSGALCTAVLDWAQSEGIGFSHFISVGNMLDVGIDDLLDYLAADPATDAVVLYVESIVRRENSCRRRMLFLVLSQSLPTRQDDSRIRRRPPLPIPGPSQALMQCMKRLLNARESCESMISTRYSIARSSCRVLNYPRVLDSQ